MKIHKLTDGTLVFPPSVAKESAPLNPLAFTESPHQAISFLATCAGITLTPEQEDAAAAVYVTLPDNATISDFLTACDHEAARQLGIPVERIEVLAPLLVALEEVAKHGRDNDLFNGVNVADCMIRD